MTNKTTANKTMKNKERFLKAYEKNLGNIGASCKAINISRQTYYEWIKKDKKFEKQVNEINELFVDMVETQLVKKIKNNDLGAIIFFLKTKGKKRGYTERIETENKQVDNFTSDSQIKIYLPKKED